MAKNEKEKALLQAVLRRIMRENLWTQADLARHAGIGEDVLSTWLTGRSMARLITLKTVAHRLGMRVDDFLPPVEGPGPAASRASKDTKLVSFRLSPGVKQALEGLAAMNRRTMTAQLEVLIEDASRSAKVR